MYPHDVERSWRVKGKSRRSRSGRSGFEDEVPVECDDDPPLAATMVAALSRRRVTKGPWPLLLLICVTSTQRSIGGVGYTPAFRLKSPRVRQISTMPPSTITVWPVM